MIAASTACERGCDVTLVEKNHKLGKKLAITGKGRCNITNACEIEELIEMYLQMENFFIVLFILLQMKM